MRQEAGVATRFLVVGLANTAVDVLVFLALYRATSSLFFAQVAAYAVGAADSYLLNKVWTFRRRGAPWRGEVVKFLAVNLASLAVTLVGLYLVTTVTGAGVLAGKLGATAAGVAVNFAGNRYWVFGSDRGGCPEAAADL